MTIAIYGSRHQEAYIDILDQFLRLLHKRGVEVVMHPKLYNYLLHLRPLALAAVRRVSASLDGTPDLTLSIGGDGTYLRTVQWVGTRPTPILGVNTGHLGFLTAATIDQLPGLLDDFESGQFTPERHSLLEVRGVDLPFEGFALNEVTVAKDANASMVEVHTAINGRHLCDYRADGLIISTPTGSTAYALSVGGPIMAPSTPAIVLAPIAAHSLSMRPMVVGDDVAVELSVSGRADHFRISVDGRSCTLPMGTPLTVCRAAHTVTLLRRVDRDFASVLTTKLGWV